MGTLWKTASDENLDDDAIRWAGSIRVCLDADAFKGCVAAEELDRLIFFGWLVHRRKRSERLTRTRSATAEQGAVAAGGCGGL